MTADPPPAVVDRTDARDVVFDVALAGWEAREAVDAGEDARVEAVKAELRAVMAVHLAGRSVVLHDGTRGLLGAECWPDLIEGMLEDLALAAQPPAPQVDTAAAVECTCGEYYDLQCAAHGDAR